MFQKLLAPLLFFVVCTGLSVAVVRADEPPPAWLLESSRLATPAYDVKDLPAVVLRNEESVNVASDGTVTRTTRYAVRILIREGRREAIARVVYQTDGEKVRDLNAWLIKTSGQPKTYGKKEVVDLAAVGNDLYNEARVRMISATSEADAGDVFGYETVTEEKTVFSQFSFMFQNDLPVLHSRVNVQLPTGWKAEGVTFNRAKVDPAVSGSSYTWELRDLAPINNEPRSPAHTSLAPRLAVSFFPAQATATPIRTFANWNDVAKWMSEIEDPQMTVDDALAAKAKELTANAKTEFEKIQAISRYVQGIQYISIQVGTKKGGGYRPHLATEVFAKSYGDCKDKANLMRAMLSVLRIEAFLVSITADDPDFVRAEWASPHQFNHCIIAVKISDATDSSAIVTHPKLGRLLMFDATDPYTPLGDFPEEQQGSLALIDHKDTDALLRMPVLPADMSKLERNIDVVLSPIGTIAGTINEKTTGQSAAQERARLKGLSATDYNSFIERWISRGASGAKATKIAPADNHTEGKFNLDVEFSAAAYAQLMQDKLMVFKPAIIGRLDRLSFNEGKRMNPFMMDAVSYTENVKIRLPQGFIVDEMPEPTKLDTPFGKYDASYQVSGEYLIFSRSLKLHRTTVPADKYDTIKSFFGRVHTAEQSPVVLMRK